MFSSVVLLQIVLVVSVQCSPFFVEEISSLRMKKAQLYEDLANHKVLSNKLTPLPMDGEVDVIFEFWPTKIISITEAEQTVTLDLVVTMYWTDKHLAWNKENYANVSKVKIPTSTIWHPNMVVSNNADLGERRVSEPPYVDLNSNGLVTLKRSLLISVVCLFDLTYYPFDTQTCGVLLTYSGQDVQLRATHVTGSMLLDDQENMPLFKYDCGWTIVNRSINTYKPFLENEFVELVITMRRASMYYVLCVLLPMTVTSMLTKLVFWIPSESGEKMSFLVSVYVSTALFLNFLGDTLPRNMYTENTPRMALFVVFVIVECFLVFVATVLVMRRHEQEKEILLRMPQLLENKTIVEGTSLESMEVLETAKEEMSRPGSTDEVDITLWSKMLRFLRFHRPNKVTGDTKDLQAQFPWPSSKSLDKCFFWVFLFTCAVFYTAIFLV